MTCWFITAYPQVNIFVPAVGVRTTAGMNAEPVPKPMHNRIFNTDNAILRGFGMTYSFFSIGRTMLNTVLPSLNYLLWSLKMRYYCKIGKLGTLGIIQRIFA